MNLKSIGSILLFLLGIIFLQAQNCDCKENYLWIKKTFEENDAGFQHILDKKGKDSYATHNKMIEDRVSKIMDYDECKLQLENWVKFFRQDHFSILKTEKAIKNQLSKENFKPIISSSQDITKFKKYLDSKKSSDLEGIWITKNSSILIKKVNNEFVGSFIESKTTFKPNEVIFKIDSDLEKGIYYASNYKPIESKNIKYLGENLLQIDRNYYQRSYPVYNFSDNTKEYLSTITATNPFGYKRDDHTVYINIPSFHNSKKAIDSIFTKMHQEIISTPNLIIDVRNAQGGQDSNYNAIIPYLYTNPIRLVMAEFYSTERNNQILKDLINNPETDEESKETFKKMLEILEQNIGKYVNVFIDKNVLEQKKDNVFNYPKNVGIIIGENNFSSTEQFILMAKQSRKVKFFGRKSGGALDVSNMIEAIVPTGDFVFEYCVSRSYRIPEFPVDDLGIHPDYYLDKTIPEDQWIDKTVEIMNYWK